MRSVIFMWILGVGGSVLGQAPDTLWTRTYGSSETDECRKVVHCPDSSLVWVGHSIRDGAGDYDFWVIKTDKEGELIWSRLFGGVGHDEAYGAVATSDGGTCIVGRTTSMSRGSYDGIVMKVNSFGDSLWSSKFGSATDNGFYGVCATSDGGFAIGGYSVLVQNGNASDAWLVKVGSNGDSLMSRTYGQGSNEFCYSIIEVTDGGLVLAGSRQTFAFAYNAWLMRTNEFGDSLWDSNIGGVWYDDFRSVTQSSDGSIFAAGVYTYPSGQTNDFLVVKLNSNGVTQWINQFGGSGFDVCYDVSFSPDGSILLGGLVSSTTSQHNDGLVIKIASNGDSIWSGMIGGAVNDKIYSLLAYEHGIFYSAGVTSSYGSGNDDYWLSKWRHEPISILRPNGTEQLHLFALDTIRWTSMIEANDVSIELNRNYPAGDWELIVDITENDGAFEWGISGLPSDSCRIRICALQDTFCDVSDGNFSIVSSQGYLALVRSSQANAPLTGWNFGAVECPSLASQWFRLKNFGSESIVVFQPLEPVSSEFARTTTCGAFFALAPNQLSACSVQVVFEPASDGVYSDVLRVQTDAVNGVNGFVEFALAGEQISTPAAPEVIITTQGLDAQLSWSAVDTSVGGCSVSDLWYAVFYSPTSGGPFYYHGWTPQTTYTHVGVVNFSATQFYQVMAVDAPSAVAAELREGMEMGEAVRKIENGKWK